MKKSFKYCTKCGAHILIAIILIAIAVYSLNNLFSKEKINFLGSIKNRIENTVTIAFVGDQGNGDDTRNVLRLIKNEGTDLAVILGDFDYEDNPVNWSEIMGLLSTSTNFIAVRGNHDMLAWNGYKEVIEKEIKDNPEILCEGELGAESSCIYKNIQFVMSSPGLSKEPHAKLIEDRLKSTTTIPWKVCLWHKNQRDMQITHKTNEVGWHVYEVCRNYGAIIATGHSHSYSRTHLLSNMISKEIVSISNTLELEPGKSFVIVSGLGGRSAYSEVGPIEKWWAAYASKDTKANPGALFCIFSTDDSNKASCYFKDIYGEIWDSFRMVSNLIKK